MGVELPITIQDAEGNPGAIGKGAVLRHGREPSGQKVLGSPSPSGQHTS
jgi:hypothetical protein